MPDQSGDPWIDELERDLGQAAALRLLANAGGIGGALADARITLDIANALAWVLIAVSLLIAVEYALVQPVKGEVDRWRRAAQPWGVKR